MTKNDKFRALIKDVYQTSEVEAYLEIRKIELLHQCLENEIDNDECAKLLDLTLDELAALKLDYNHQTINEVSGILLLKLDIYQELIQNFYLELLELTQNEELDSKQKMMFKHLRQELIQVRFSLDDYQSLNICKQALKENQALALRCVNEYHEEILSAAELANVLILGDVQIADLYQKYASSDLNQVYQFLLNQEGVVAQMFSILNQLLESMIRDIKPEIYLLNDNHELELMELIVQFKELYMKASK